jgi:hypothetical protein
MPSASEVEQLNAVKYLYLRELSEPRDNSLRIVVEEAVVNPSGIIAPEFLERPELAVIREGASPIESVEGCRLFELHWKRYAAYLVTEECVGSSAAKGYDDERYDGRILRVYSESHFLTYMTRDTGGHIEPLQHYKLVCLNHLIDIAAYAPPKIRVLSSMSNTQDRIQ